MEKQLTKAIDGKMYSFNSRYISVEMAKSKAKLLNGLKHCYYTRVSEGGSKFYDVRTEN